MIKFPRGSLLDLPFAIYYEPEAYSMDGKVMGRQSAGAAFMQAVADSGMNHLWCYARTEIEASHCVSTLARLGAERTKISWIPAGHPEQLARAELLYRPDPGIGQHAWHRLSRSDPRAYSICGITHTLSTHETTSAIADYLTAPVEPWDAIICTSTVARDAVRYVLEEQAAYLRERLGAARFTLPQLPVIPLGVHTRRYAFTPDERAAARARLGLADDEVVVLYAGRLIVHGKAHPLPMYLALEQAARDRKVVLIQAGRAPNAEILGIYTEEPKRFCPSVRTLMVEGGDHELYRASWAAADIFTSLADNIQETFGLTPVEAMAAGLPVVVTDWDGYKDTVRDGIDGFRVPTLTLPAGQGGGLADRHSLMIDDFDHFSGYTSQLVAADIDATAQAYRTLIDDPGLRNRMGDAGRARARGAFDWSTVFGRYLELWEELAQRRRSDPQLVPALQPRRRPDRPDPFAMFATYPTYHVGPGVWFHRRPEADPAEIKSRRDLASTNFAGIVQPSSEIIDFILDATAIDWIEYREITARAPGTREEIITAALVWMCKVGALRASEKAPSIDGSKPVGLNTTTEGGGLTRPGGT